MKQRVLGIALGYEDLVDHDELCRDSVLAMLSGCSDMTGSGRVRASDRDGAAGTVEKLVCIIGRLRVRWPKVRIIVRGDSGFCREALMSWCEGQGVEYVLGLAKNPRLKALIADELQQAQAGYESSGEAVQGVPFPDVNKLVVCTARGGQCRTLEQRGESPLYRGVPPV